jgi:hypothetical protein
MDPFPVHDDVGAAAADDTADVGLPFDIGPKHAVWKLGTRA